MARLHSWSLCDRYAYGCAVSFTTLTVRLHSRVLAGSDGWRDCALQSEAGELWKPPIGARRLPA